MARFPSPERPRVPRTRPLPLLVLLAALGVAAVPEPLRAADDERRRTGRALALDDAVALAIERSPAVRLAETEVDRARGGRKDAEPYFPDNPRLSFDGGPRDQADVRGTKFSYQARVEQPVDVFGQRGKRLDAADEKIRLAEAQLDVARSEVALRARAAYVATLVGERRLRFAEDRVANAARVVESARARVASGASAEVEERLADAELGRAKVEALAARIAIEQARTALRTVLDLPATEPLDLATRLGLPPPRGSPEQGLVATALSRRRELLALRQEGKALDADLERLRAERLPPVAIALNVEQDSRDQYWAGPGIVVTAPVWKRNQGAIAQTEAERRRNRIALETSEATTERELRLALANAKLRREELALLEEVLRAVTRSRDLVREGWEAGKFDIFRVLTIDRELVGTQAGWLEAISGLWDAELEIDRAMGLGVEDRA